MHRVPPSPRPPEPAVPAEGPHLHTWRVWRRTGRYSDPSGCLWSLIGQVKAADSFEAVELIAPNERNYFLALHCDRRRRQALFDAPDLHVFDDPFTFDDVQVICTLTLWGRIKDFAS